MQRSIAIYYQKTEKLKEEIHIGNIKIEKLQSIIRSSDDDPYLYGTYEITEEATTEWNALIPNPVSFDFQEYAYFVECVQLPPYEFEKKKAIREIEQLLVKLGANSDAFLQAESANLTPAVKAIPGFPKAEKVSSKTGNIRWRDLNGDILEWNRVAGNVEVYNKTGKFHRGAADPETGQIKPGSASSGKTTQN